MTNLFKSLFLLDLAEVRLQRSTDGQWMVSKEGRIHFIGTKDKCKTYMKELRVAGSH